MVTGIPIEPGVPDWMKRFALRNDQAWLPLVPQKPVRLPTYTTSDLPSAAAYPYCMAFDTSLGLLVVSDGTNWIS